MTTLDQFFLSEKEKELTRIKNDQKEFFASNSNKVRSVLESEFSKQLSDRYTYEYMHRFNENGDGIINRFKRNLWEDFQVRRKEFITNPVQSYFDKYLSSQKEKIRLLWEKKPHDPFHFGFDEEFHEASDLEIVKFLAVCSALDEAQITIKNISKSDVKEISGKQLSTKQLVIALEIMFGDSDQWQGLSFSQKAHYTHLLTGKSFENLRKEFSNYSSVGHKLNETMTSQKNDLLALGDFFDLFDPFSKRKLVNENIKELSKY